MIEQTEPTATAPLADAVAEIDPASWEIVSIPTANPVNFAEAVSEAGPRVRLEIQALLAFPGVAGPHPLVMVVPGSAGVSPNHVAHCKTLLGEGFGICLVDPFTARAVVSTVANQTQYSFAASAYDVLAAYRVVAADPRVLADKISAQGHSRGGSAVLTAAMRRFADPIIGEGHGLAGVYAAYPWCGQQFADASVGTTVVRSIIGDQDQWGSVIAAQTQVQSIVRAGGAATFRIVAGAHHSFDRQGSVYDVPEARISPHAPIEFIADDGSLIDAYTGIADPNRTDADQFRLAARSGFGRRGALMGGGPGLPELFVADALAFHVATLRN